MVNILDIRVIGTQRLNKRLNRIKKNLPKELTDSINEWGQELKKAYRNYVATRHHFSGQTEDSFKWVNLTREGKRGYISVRMEGYFLSEAKRHRAPVTYRLKKWVNQKIPGYQGKKIWVQGHPYIRQVFLLRYLRLRAKLVSAARRGLI